MVSQENKDKMKAYYQANKDKIAERRKAHYQANKDKVLEAAKAYRQANKDKAATYRQENKDKIAAYTKDRYQANKEKFAESAKKYRQANKGRIAEVKKAWRKSNPQKTLAIGRNRRARKRKASGTHTADDIQALLTLQRKKCAICYVSIARGYHVDHIKPLVLGGSNDKGNLQLLCPTCNYSKGAKHPIEFMKTLGMLL